MTFTKFYCVASAVLIVVLMVQRVIWLNCPNDITHSIGFALTGLMMFWWLVSIVAAFKFKSEGLSVVLPLAWIGYEVLVIGSGILLRSLLESNATINAVHIACLFIAEGGFVAMYAMLAKRLLTRSEKSDT